MSIFSSAFMPAIGSSSSRSFGDATSARASSTRFCRPYGRLPTIASRYRADIEEIDDLLGRSRNARRSARARGQPERAFEESAAADARQAGQHVVEHAQPVEQRVVLKGARDAALGGGACGRRPLERFAVEQDLTRAGAIDSVDDVEQRTLAGPVGADQRADLAARDGKAEVGKRPDLAEG